MPRKPFGTESLRSDGSSTGPNRHVSFNNETRRFGSGLDLSGSYPAEDHGGNTRPAYKGLHRLREDDEGSDKAYYPRETMRRPPNNEIPRHYATENRTLERHVPHQPRHYDSDSLPRFPKNKTLNERSTGQGHYGREDGYRDSVPYKINDFMEDSESDIEKDHHHHHHHQSFDSWDRKRSNEFSRRHDSGSESDPEYRYHSSQSPTRKPKLTRGNVSMLAQQLIEETKQRQQARQLFSERNANLSFDGAKNRPFSYMDGSPTRSPTFKPGTSPVRHFHDDDDDDNEDMKPFRIDESTLRRENTTNQWNKNSHGISYDSEDNSPREGVRNRSPVRHFRDDDDLKHARIEETATRRENNTTSHWNKSSHGISYDSEDNLPREGVRKRSEDEEKEDRGYFSTHSNSRKHQEAFEVETGTKPSTGKRLATYVFGQEGKTDMFSNNRRDNFDRDKEIKSQDYKPRLGSSSYLPESLSRPIEIPKSAYGTQTMVYNNLESPQKHDDVIFRASYRRTSPSFDQPVHRGYSDNLTKDSRPTRQPSPIRRELSPEIPPSYWKSNQEINVLKDRKVKEYQSSATRDQADAEILDQDRYRRESPSRTGFMARSADLYERNSSSPERQTLPSKRMPVHGGLFNEEPRNASYRSSRRSDFEQFQRRINNDRLVPRMGTSLTKDFSLTTHNNNETDEVPKPPLRLKKLTGHQARDKLDNGLTTSTTFVNKPVYIHNQTHPEEPAAEEFRGVRNLVGKIQSRDPAENYRVRTNRNLTTEKYHQDHHDYLEKRRSVSSSSERSSPSPTRQISLNQSSKSFSKFKKYKAPEPPSPRQDEEEVKPYVRTSQTDRYYVARHSPERQPSPEEYTLRRRKLNEAAEEYVDETLVPSIQSKHKLYQSQKASDEHSGSTTTGRIGSSSVRFADNFTSHKSKKDYGSKPNLSKSYGDLESRSGVVYQNNELESGDSDKDSKIQRQRKNFFSVFLGGDRRLASSKKSGHVVKQPTNTKPDNRNKSILIREEDSYKGSLKNEKARDRKIAKQKRNSKEDIEVGRGIVKSRSTQNLHEYETSLKASADGNKDYRASPYLDEPDNSSYFKVQANDASNLPAKDNPKYSSSFSLKRSDTLKKNFPKISNPEREGKFVKKSSYSPPDGYYTTQYSRSGRTAEENRGHKNASHGPAGEFDDDSTLYFTSSYATRKKEPSPIRYFGDTDTERHSKDSSGGSPGHAYVSGSKRLGRSTSYIGDTRRSDKSDRNLNPRRAGGLGQNNFLSSSESELSSKVSNQVSGASGDSRRSQVYVHASTVAKIPKYHSAEPKPNINDVENQSHLTSTEGSIDRFPGTTPRGANFQRSKRISRSFSVLAPWKPRHYKENYEITYNNNQPVKPAPVGTGKPPRPPNKRREVQSEKQPINTEITPNSKPDNLTTLPKNANHEKDKNKNKNSVSRSSTMPKDSRMAGWFRKIRK